MGNNFTTTAATSPAGITTVALVKTYSGISGTAWDSALTGIVTAVNTTLPKWCERDSFSATAYTSVTNGTGMDYFELPNTPINTLTSIVFDYDTSSPTTILGAEFKFCPETGLVMFDPDSAYRRSFNYGFRNIQTNYNGGYSTLPDDLVQAATVAAATALELAQHGDQTASEKIGDYSVAFFARSFVIDPVYQPVREMLYAGGYKRIPCL